MLPKSNYFYNQLDGLRALAVLMTLGAHFIPRVGIHEVPYLWYGVDIFFTISGFLITGILLKMRNSEQKHSDIKKFYFRRALRLFPAYYILILVFFFARNLGHLYIWNNNYNAYFFFYLPNWFFFFHPDQGSGSFNHIWSLGVEEQFYFIWPWLIIFLPLKRVVNIIVFVIIIAILFNVIFYKHAEYRMLPLNNLHTLGIGGLLAYYFYCRNNSKVYIKYVKWLKYILPSSFILFILFIFQRIFF